MNLLRNASVVAILGLGMAGCLSETDSSANSAPNSEYPTAAATDFDTVKFSEDHIALIPKSEATLAGRPILHDPGDGFFRTLKWPGGTVVRVSLQGTVPTGSKAIIDTVTRYWSSLIDADAASRISFQVVGNNDASAQVKIYFSAQSHAEALAVAEPSLSYRANNPSPFVITGGTITFYAKTGTTTNNWTSRDFLFNVALHEMGHLIGLNDEYDAAYKGEVMFGRVDRTAPRKFFGTDDVQSINELFHGSRSTYSKWIPVFNGGDTGWAAAKAAYAAKRGNYKLLGIALPTTDNRAGLTTLYRFKRTNGTFALWDEQNSSTLTCPDNGVAPGQAGQAFVKVFANTEGNNEPTTGLLHGNSYLMTHRPDATIGWTNVFVNAVQPNFGCQRQVGWIPSLKAE